MAIDINAILAASPDVVAASPEMKRILEVAAQVAATDVTVLITGESGTGKEVVASFIHRQSKRRDKEYVSINCGAIAAGILESELFGHEKGAFTGASEARKGYFETATGGTVFLDEVGEMPLETQVKLLRVLETGEFQRVGASRTTKVDVRIIAATNRDLREEVRAKRFREDLYYRLRTVDLELPPLRERPADVLKLAENFVKHFEKKHGLKFIGFTAEATELLLRHDWRGNVRELRNLIESLIVLEQRDGSALEPEAGSQDAPEEKITPEKLARYLRRDSPLSSYPVLSMPPSPQERDLVYRALMQLELEVADIKSMLAKLLEQQAQAQLDPSRLLSAAASVSAAAPPELLPTGANGQPEMNLREMLKAFYTEATDSGRLPSLEELERYAIEQALKKFNGNKRKTAEALGITERTLYRKLAAEKTAAENAASENDTDDAGDAGDAGDADESGETGD